MLAVVEVVVVERLAYTVREDESDVLPLGEAQPLFVLETLRDGCAR